MKHYFILIHAFLAMIFVSCQENILQQDVPSTTDVAEELHSGMKRIKFNTRSELKGVINQLGESSSSRSLVDVTYSDNEDMFVSLVEANRQKVMAGLTAAQLQTVMNDVDELEFDPSDSIIADIRFAQLLNANREIQVGDTIFKYYRNGVAYTNVLYEDLLNEIDEEVSQITVTPENEGQSIVLRNGTGFTRVLYQTIPVDETHVGLSGAIDQNTYDPPTRRGSSNKGGMLLSDGTLIPASSIRVVEYEKGGGDGDWFHQLWTGIWGTNVVAINKFAENKKLTMNFYEQDYIIYKNIGTKLKMQKRVCGIWWNIKAQEMEQGWETVTLKYTDNNLTVAPNIRYGECVTMEAKLPFTDDIAWLFRLPIEYCDTVSNDVNTSFENNIKFSYNNGSQWACEKANSLNVGTYIENTPFHYLSFGSHCERKANERSVETKFYSNYNLPFITIYASLGGSFRDMGLSMPKNTKVELYCGKVYGAIKYGDRWLAATIEKSIE
jgi:hypothetical protein